MRQATSEQFPPWSCSEPTSEGVLCSFSRDGLIVQRRTSGAGTRFDRIPAGLATIAMAVTASSAFPGFFPPVRLATEDIGATEGEFPGQAFTPRQNRCRLNCSVTFGAER